VEEAVLLLVLQGLLVQLAVLVQQALQVALVVVTPKVMLQHPKRMKT